MCAALRGGFCLSAILVNTWSTFDESPFKPGGQRPNHRFPHLGQAIAKLQSTEKIVLDPARNGFADFASFEAAWAAFEASRT